MGRPPQRPEDEAGARHRVLQALREAGPPTAEELAVRLGGGPVAMRVHLRQLVAEGLVDHEPDRKAMGRPARRFRLTPAADARFPKQYDLLALKLMESVAEDLGPAALERVLSRWEDLLHAHLDATLPKDPAARRAALAAHQASYGFMPALQEAATGSTLLEKNCPIAQVAARFPTICDHEAALFARVLGEPVALTGCQARGDAVCAFRLGQQKTS